MECGKPTLVTTTAKVVFMCCILKYMYLIVSKAVQHFLCLYKWSEFLCGFALYITAYFCLKHYRRRLKNALKQGLRTSQKMNSMIGLVGKL